MMKKPEEIKKGLEIAVNGCLPCDRPITDCPYDLECRPTSKDTNVDMPKQMAADAIAYIQQQENHIGELTEKVAKLEAAQPRWNNVKDGIPKEEGKYIVCTERGRVYCTRFYKGGGCEGIFKTDINTHITYWMPLPEPPKEGE